MDSILKKLLGNNLTTDVAIVITKTAFVKSFTSLDSCLEISREDYKNRGKSKNIITLSTNFALA